MGEELALDSFLFVCFLYWIDWWISRESLNEWAFGSLVCRTFMYIFFKLRAPISSDCKLPLSRNCILFICVPCAWHMINVCWTEWRLYHVKDTWRIISELKAGMVGFTYSWRIKVKEQEFWSYRCLAKVCTLIEQLVFLIGVLSSYDEADYLVSEFTRRPQRSAAVALEMWWIDFIFVTFGDRNGPLCLAFSKCILSLFQIMLWL